MEMLTPVIPAGSPVRAPRALGVVGAEAIGPFRQIDRFTREAPVREITVPKGERRNGKPRRAASHV